MPTSRYESYPSLDETESKEKIVGDDRLNRAIGRLALTSKEDES